MSVLKVGGPAYSDSTVPRPRNYLFDLNIASVIIAIRHVIFLISIVIHPGINLQMSLQHDGALRARPH